MCRRFIFLFALINFACGKYVDLTWPFDNRSVYPAGIKPFEFTKMVASFLPNGDWLAWNEFCAAEHGGTHLDAPYHTNEQGWKVTDIPIEHLIAPGVCINLVNETQSEGPNTTLKPEHIEAWEARNGIIPSGSLVLIQFGWAKYYYTSTYKYADGGNTSTSFPGISLEAAAILVEREVYGVGVDTSSVDAGAATANDAHRVLSHANIFNMENVNIPEVFPETGFELFAFPMLIGDGTGAPLRLMASCDAEY